MSLETYGAIDAVLKKYIDGTYRADVALLKSIFHPDALMSGVLGGNQLVGGPNVFFEALASRPSPKSEKAPYSAHVVMIQPTDLVASASLVEYNLFGASFVNHFHLLKQPEGHWLIVSKLFHQM